MFQKEIVKIAKIENQNVHKIDIIDLGSNRHFLMSKSKESKEIQLCILGHDDMKEKRHGTERDSERFNIFMTFTEMSK